LPRLIGWLLKPSGKKYAWDTERFQKISSFPGMSNEVSYRDKMWNNQKQFMRKHPQLPMPFVLPSFILPAEREEFRRAWERTENKMWISKMPVSSLSHGIRMLEHWKDFPEKKNVVQKYVHNPILYDNIKVELKHSFVVTSVHPLRIYSHPGVLVALLAKANYSTHPEDIGNLCIHTRVKKIKCDRANFLHQLSPAAYLEMMGVLDTKYNFQKLIHSMDEAVILTLLSAESRLSKAFYRNAKNRYNYMHLMTADFMVDENGQPWLMEMNGAPLRDVNVPWRKERNYDFYSKILNIAGYHLPPTIGAQAEAIVRNSSGFENTTKVVMDESLYRIKLTPNEKLKQDKYANITDRSTYMNSILDDLTEDDVHMLMAVEDELNRVKFGRRIFPTRSVAKYIPFIESNNYYYKLLDAWENKYGETRSIGRQVLENQEKS